MGGVTYILIFMLCVSSVLCVWAGLSLLCRPVESVRDYRRLHIAGLFWGLVTSDITQGTRSHSMSTERPYFTAVVYILCIICWQLNHTCCSLHLPMTRLLNQEFILYWKFEHSPIIASGEEIKLDFIINSTQIIIDLDFSWVPNVRWLQQSASLLRSLVIFLTAIERITSSRGSQKSNIPSCLLEPFFFSFCS